MARPFTDRVKNLRAQGKRYIDLSLGCNEVRSSAWFNNLLNSNNPWIVNPPTEPTFAGLATLMRTNVPHIRQMIAEEWYDVLVDQPSARVRTLAPRVDTLSEDDFRLVESLAQRLQPESGASPEAA